MNHEPVTHASQSECKLAQDCGLSWYAQWCLGYRAPDSDNPAMRIGTLGHAYLAEYVMWLAKGHDGPVPEVMRAAAMKRGYIPPDDPEMDAMDDDRRHILLGQMERATHAANVLIASPEWDLDPHRLAFSPADGGANIPLVEHRLKASWAELERNAGLVLPPAMRATFHGHGRRPPFAGHAYRLGAEGVPDVGHWGRRGDGVLFADDYKFRTKPVDTSPPSPFAASVPDTQGAYYKTLLRALNIDITDDGSGDVDVVFRQVNIYAGPWRTLDDFLERDSPYVIDSGLPSRSYAILDGMVTAEIWAEAWRLLVERRRIATMDRRDRKGNANPRRETDTEIADARKFIGELERRKAVHIVATPRLDHSVCVQVVRDMLAPVAALLAQVDSGVIPGRNLRSHPSSPCVRSGGCRVQAPCLASLGSNNAAATFIDHARSGRLHHLAVVREVGEYNPEETTTP